MKSLAILTDLTNKNMVPDEVDLPKVFKEAEVEFDVVIWDQADWTQYKNVLIRTPWDYSEKSDLFEQKINEAIEANVNIIHSPEIIRWNMDKKYLIELSTKMKVVRTECEEQFNSKTASSYFDTLGVNELVFKPKIGAGGRDTFKLEKNDDLSVLDVLNGQPVLIQPYISSITEIGEYSFIFFDSEFSHAVLKKAKEGEFRVQDNHGGTVFAYEPNNLELEQIQKMLHALHYKTVYARVDVVKHEGEFFLMEMEIIEPELFFRFSKNGMERFVSAVKKHLN